MFPIALSELLATAGFTRSPEHCLLPTIAWVVVAAVLAIQLFRWEPR